MEDVTELELKCLESGNWTDFENLTCNAIVCPIPITTPHSIIASENQGRSVCRYLKFTKHKLQLSNSPNIFDAGK